MTTHRHKHGDETPADHTAKIVGTSVAEHLGAPALTIHQLLERHRRRQATPREVCAHLVASARSSDPAIRITLLDDADLEPALTRIEATDPDAPPLYRIPFNIKDNIDLAGVPATAACPAFEYVLSTSATRRTTSHRRRRHPPRQDEPRPIRHRPRRCPIALRHPDEPLQR